jgi:hypothetical protein
MDPQFELPELNDRPMSLTDASQRLSGNTVTTTPQSLLGGFVDETISGNGGWYTQQKGTIANLNNPFSHYSPIRYGPRELANVQQWIQPTYQAAARDPAANDTSHRWTE